MSWRDSLRPASFRGAPFFVSESESGFGRRLVVHEYPLKNRHFVEDLGLAARTFSITGYVLGQNYFTARDALIDACEKDGAGTLVHPYKGTKSVHFRSGSMRETKEDGGICYFTMEFVEAGLQQYPARSLNPLSALGLAGDSLVSAAEGSFLSAITVDGVPDFVRKAFGGTVGDIGALLGSLQSGSGLLQAAGLQPLINEAAQFSMLAQSLKNMASGALLAPLSVADSIKRIFQSVRSMAFSPASAVTAYRTSRSLAVTTRPESTALITLENRNKAATKRFSDLVSLAGEAQVLPLVPYTSYEEAIEARSLFLDTVDQYTGGATDSEYVALQGLRTALAGALPLPAKDLPRLRTVVLPEVKPSLVVAYDLYEDAGREKEITDRNRQRHPGFLDAGKALEVLSA